MSLIRVESWNGGKHTMNETKKKKQNYEGNEYFNFKHIDSTYLLIAMDVSINPQAPCHWRWRWHNRANARKRINNNEKRTTL